MPNFGDEALPRAYALVTDEATGPDIQCPNPVRTKVYMLDITHADETGVRTPSIPGRFLMATSARKEVVSGPHQFAETVNSTLNRFENKIAYVAYFNAG